MTTVHIRNGPLHPLEMVRRVEALRPDAVVLRPAGNGPGLGYSWEGEFLWGPEAFRGSTIDTYHLKKG